MATGTCLALLRQAPPAPPLLEVLQARPVVFHAQLESLYERQGYRWAQLSHLRNLQGQALATADATLLALPVEGIHSLRPGTELRVSGRLVQERRGWRVEAARFETRKRGPPLSWERIRQALRQRWQRQLQADEAGLAIALILGERGGLPPWQQEAYRQFGLVHLLAVSGMHLWVWDLLFRRLFLRRGQFLRWPFLVLMTALAGGKPPVLRALCVLLLRDGAHAQAWRLSGLQLWTYAWAVECLLFAPQFDDLGLLLSYSATFFLILGAKGESSKVWRQALRASWVAFLGSMPLLHAVQATIEPWSIVLSPIMALLLPLRLFFSLLALLPGGGWCASLLLQGMGALEQALFRWGQHLPASPWLCPQRSSVLLAVGAVCLLAALALPRAKKAWRPLCFALGGLACCVRLPAQPGLVLLDSGHGLAVLVAGEHQSVLFDCGSASRKPRDLIDRELLPTLRRGPYAPPSRVVLSHQDDDHVNALAACQQRLPLFPVEVAANQRRAMSGLEPWTVEVLGIEGAAQQVRNNGGHVLSLHYRGRRIVVLGDQEGHSLRTLCRRLAPGPIDVLILPHHGLSTDGLFELLQHLKPREAWASCGEEDFPLPVAPLLDHLEIPLRTTLQGSLVW